MEAVLTGKWADGKTRPATDGNLYYYTLSTSLEAEPDYTTDFQIRYQLADAAGPLVQLIHNAYTPTQNPDSWVTVDGEVLIYVPNVNRYADDPETQLPALLNNLADNPADERHVYLYSNVTMENTAWLPALEARFPNWTIHVTLGHCQHVEHQKTRWQLNSRS